LTNYPAAVVVHDLPGRTRLRIEAKLGDRSYFEATERALRECPAVRQVSGSSLTGSLLIVRQGELAAVAEFARERSLFDLVTATVPDTFSDIQQQVRMLDEKLRQKSGQRWGVPGVTFYGLLGAGLWQLTQGRVLPPTVTLLFQALNVFKQAVEDERLARSRISKE
jgi:hypothetical protein